jgi:hypothetical protein
MPGGQFVILVNDGSTPVDINCWSLRSRATGKTTRVLFDMPLAAGAAARLLADSTAMSGADTLTLTDGAGAVVDRTPRLKDTADDVVPYRADDGAWRYDGDFQLPSPMTDGRLADAGTSC